MSALLPLLQKRALAALLRRGTHHARRGRAWTDDHIETIAAGAVLSGGGRIRTVASGLAAAELPRTGRSQRKRPHQEQSHPLARGSYPAGHAAAMPFSPCCRLTSLAVAPPVHPRWLCARSCHAGRTSAPPCPSRPAGRAAAPHIGRLTFPPRWPARRSCPAAVPRVPGPLMLVWLFHPA